MFDPRGDSVRELILDQILCEHSFSVALSLLAYSDR
jgi:hypothetical protein